MNFSIHNKGKALFLSFLDIILLSVLHVLLVLSLLIGNSVIELAFVVIWLLIAARPIGFLTVPMLTVFSNILQLPFISGGFYKYAIIILLVFELGKKRNILITKSRAMELSVCILFIVFVLLQYKGASVLSYIPVLLYYCIIWPELEENSDKCILFYQMFVFAVLISIAVGFLQGRTHTEVSVIGSSQMQLTRFFATFVDPNYAGLFINAAICMCIGLGLFSGFIRIPILIVLYAALFMTSSMTALLCNIMIVGYIALYKYSFKLKYVLPVMAVLIIVVSVFASGIYTRISLVNSVITRGQLKFRALFVENNMAAFTSGRTGLTQAHWEFLLTEGSLLNWLFGGIPATALYCSELLGGKAAHLEYLDLILNVGIVGMSIYLGSILYRFNKALRLRKKRNTDFDITRCGLFLNYLACGFSLSLFMEPQFFLWVFL